MNSKIVLFTQQMHALKAAIFYHLNELENRTFHTLNG